MGRLKTVNTGGKLASFSGSLRVLSESEGMLQKVEVMLLNSDVNRNNWQYLNLAEHRHLFADTPLLVAYKGKQVGDGHNFDEVRNPDGTVTASFMSATAERVVGWFRSESDIRLETIDNKEWIVGIGYIWKWYAQELVAKLRGQGRENGGMAVSIETLIDEMHMDGDTEVYTKYQILGTTILGDDVAPAVVDAGIRALSAIGTAEIRKMTLRVASAEVLQQLQKFNPQSLADSGNKRGEDDKSGSIDKTKGKLLMNSKRLKELSALFPDFRFITADENSVTLCSVEGDFYRVPYDVDNGTIIPGAKTSVNAVVVIGEGDNAVSVPLNDVRGEDVQTINDLTEKLNAAEKGRDSALKTLEDMRKAETERRKEACRNAIENCFNEFKESCDADFDEKLCEEFLTDEKLCEYAEMEKDGKFCGDAAAVRDVSAKCAKVMKDAAKEKKARENAKKTYAFDRNDGEDGASDGFDKMIQSIMAD